MAYSDKAKELRQCKATKQNGEPCQAFAMWGYDVCVSHSEKRGKGPQKRNYDRIKPNIQACRCEAYQFPHRPGGGLCRWPDEPIYKSTIKAGTRAWWKQLVKKKRGRPKKRK